MHFNKLGKLVSLFITSVIMSCSQATLNTNTTNDIIKKQTLNDNSNNKTLNNNQTDSANLKLNTTLNENIANTENLTTNVNTKSTQTVNNLITNDLSSIVQPLTKSENFDSVDISDALISYNDISAVFKESEAVVYTPTDSNILISTFSTKSYNQKKQPQYVKKQSYQGEQWYLDNDTENDLKCGANRVKEQVTYQQKYTPTKIEYKFQQKQMVDLKKVTDVTFHKKSNVKCSDEVSFDTQDGNTTKSSQVEFKYNQRSKVTTVDKIYDKKSNKLRKITHNFNEKNEKYDQIAFSLTTFNSDGSKTIDTECTHNFFDGKVRKMHVTKTLDRFGKGQGVGIINVCHSNGKTEVYNVDISANNDLLSCSVKSPDNKEKVEVKQTTDGNLNVVTNNDNKVISIDDWWYHNTVSNPTPTPTATPVASNTPVSTPIPTPTPVISSTLTPTPIPIATPTATPVALNTPISTPTPTPTPVPTATPTPLVADSPTSTATPTATPTPTPTKSPKSEDDKEEKDKNTKDNNGLGDTKDGDNTTKGVDTSNPGHN